MNTRIIAFVVLVLALMTASCSGQNVTSFDNPSRDASYGTTGPGSTSPYTTMDITAQWNAHCAQFGFRQKTANMTFGQAYLGSPANADQALYNFKYYLYTEVLTLGGTSIGDIMTLGGTSIGDIMTLGGTSIGDVMKTGIERWPVPRV